MERNKGSRVYNQLSLIPYPKHVHFAFLTLTVKYWGSRRHMPLNKTIIVTLEIVALNYPCPIIRLRTVSHSNSRDPGLESHRGNYYCCDVTSKNQYVSRQTMGLGHPKWPGATVDVFLNFGGGRYQTHWQHPARAHH
jgi:hypothetical protein